jgi:short-subunit dehydrogenase
MMDADVVARGGYRGLMRGKRVVIPGLMNLLTSKLTNFVPTGVTTKIVRKLNGK